MDNVSVTAVVTADVSHHEPITTLGLLKRAVLLVDGNNVYYGARAQGARLNYKALLRWTSTEYTLVKVVHYSTHIGDGSNGFLFALRKMGFEVKSRPPKVFKRAAPIKVECPHCALSSELVLDKVDGDLDVLIAVDAIEMALSGYIDHLILLSGDMHFVPLLRFLKARGITVDVMAFEHNIASELRHEATRFIAVPTDLLMEIPPVSPN